MQQLGFIDSRKRLAVRKTTSGEHMGSLQHIIVCIALKRLLLFPFITRRWRLSPYQTSDSRIADTAVCGLPTGAADTGGCFSAALYSRRFREASSTPRQRLIWRLCSCSLFERGDGGYLPIKRPIRGSGQASRLRNAKKINVGLHAKPSPEEKVAHCLRRLVIFA